LEPGKETLSGFKALLYFLIGRAENTSGSGGFIWSPPGASGDRVGQDVDPLEEAIDGELSVAGQAIDDVERNPAMGAPKPRRHRTGAQAEVLGHAVLAGRFATGGHFAFDGLEDDREGFQEQVFGRAGDIHES
jgi:hypothetical protein